VRQLYCYYLLSVEGDDDDDYTNSVSECESLITENQIFQFYSYRKSRSEFKLKVIFTQNDKYKIYKVIYIFFAKMTKFIF